MQRVTFTAYITDAPASYGEVPDVGEQVQGMQAHHIESKIEHSPSSRWDKRPVLAAILEDLEAKRVRGVAVYSFGALGLSTLGVVALVQQVAKLGGHIWALKDGVSSLDPKGLEMIRLLYNLGECTTSKLRRVGTLSERPKKTRYLPFGWRLGKTSGPWERSKENGDLEPVRNPTEQVMLQEILDHCGGTGKGAYALAKRFNGEGRKHPRLKKDWKAGNILAIYETAAKYQQDARVELTKLALRQGLPTQIDRPPVKQPTAQSTQTAHVG